jgi:hypothetical protein
MSWRPAATPRQLCFKQAQGALVLARPRLHARDRVYLFVRAPGAKPAADDSSDSSDSDDTSSDDEPHSSRPRTEGDKTSLLVLPADLLDKVTEFMSAWSMLQLEMALNLHNSHENLSNIAQLANSGNIIGLLLEARKTLVKALHYFPDPDLPDSRVADFLEAKMKFDDVLKYVREHRVDIIRTSASNSESAHLSGADPRLVARQRRPTAAVFFFMAVLKHLLEIVTVPHWKTAGMASFAKLPDVVVRDMCVYSPFVDADLWLERTGEEMDPGAEKFIERGALKLKEFIGRLPVEMQAPVNIFDYLMKKDYQTLKAGVVPGPGIFDSPSSLTSKVTFYTRDLSAGFICCLRRKPVAVSMVSDDDLYSPDASESCYFTFESAQVVHQFSEETKLAKMEIAFTGCHVFTSMSCCSCQFGPRNDTIKKASQCYEEFPYSNAECRLQWAQSYPGAVGFFNISAAHARMKGFRMFGTLGHAWTFMLEGNASQPIDMYLPLYESDEAT